MDLKKDIGLAIETLKYSYSPYSKFKVGAVLIGKDGTRFTGVNVESASYSPTNCAERTAFFKAVSEGVRDFEKIIIVGGINGILDDYTPPCGVCRQVMAEFCDPETFEVILAKAVDDYKIYKLKDLLPLGFGPKSLRREENNNENV